MNKIFLLFVCFFCYFLPYGQQAETFTDARNGKEYTCLKIGKQTWSSSNLDVETFRNGDTIPEVRSASEWEKLGDQSKPCWCYYNNDSTNNSKYGKLYNWYAVTDPRGLAPKGWHIPTDKEWDSLVVALGGEFTAGSKMKNVSGWNMSGNGDNSSGFAAVPGGYRNYDGTFHFIGGDCYWWSSDENAELDIWYRNLSAFYSGVNKYGGFSRQNGLSVRCVKD